VSGVGGIRGAAAGPVPPEGEEERLKKAARQLEGVFVQQLFKAMRETIPHEGVIDGGSGEEMFTGLLDEHMSEAVPQQWERGVGEALLRQLRGALAAQSSRAATDTQQGAASEVRALEAQATAATTNATRGR
jgi:flagellar protein FlgJ